VGGFFDNIVGVSLAKVDVNHDGEPGRDLMANWVETAPEGDNI
jgi:hypothetical protein